MLRLALLLVSGSALLYACGGGGGNPGTCNASAETCGQQGSSTGAPSGSGSGTGDQVTPVVLVSENQLKTVTCAQILSLNGGNTNNTFFAAQDAFNRGATQLDSEPKDGIPCNG